MIQQSFETSFDPPQQLILIFPIFLEQLTVSLLIRWGQVPDKYETANTKAAIMGLYQTNLGYKFHSVFAAFASTNIQNHEKRGPPGFILSS